METNTIEIWMLSAIAAAAISLAIALVIWLSGKKDTTANIPDRYKYPKKDCECDCLGECKDKKDDGIIKIELENKIPNPQTLNSYWVKIDGIPYRFKYYMRRGNNRYYRGDGVKVVITVK